VRLFGRWEDVVIGAVIGQYKIIRKLGEGGMGTVYLGQHQLLGRKAAVKVLLPQLSQRADIVTRFFNEARAATSIQDPGIVQIFDFGFHTDQSAYIVMEFLEGEPLDARLHKLGRLPVADALRITRQCASSLAAAHAMHIIHRDLKPENIFLVRDPEVATGERAKILDFGIAKLVDDEPGKIKTSVGALMGTPVYMSPEQCRGAGEVDHRSDIYALGCVLFHLLVGKPPFEGDGMGEIIAMQLREPPPLPSSRAPGIPPEVDALVLRALAKPVDERYQSMTEFALAIGQLLPYLTAPGAAPSQPPPYTPGYTPVPPVSAPSVRPGTPPPTTPTTLGSSSGQVHDRPRSRAGWIIAAALVAGGGGAAIAIAMSGTKAAPTAPAAPTAAVAPPAPATAVDARAPIVTPDAPIVTPAIVTPDAGPPDAGPPDAALKVPNAHHHRPHAGSGSGSAPADPTDLDGDGIPDVR
jgi:serine/threonine-protein kinase